MTIDHRSRPAKRAFTLIELLVVVAIIALLISILLPSLTRARQQAQGAVCMSNLHQINIGLTQFRWEHKDCWPWNLWSEYFWPAPYTDPPESSKRTTWFYKLYPRYVSDGDVFVCPGDPLQNRFDIELRQSRRHGACGYGFNYVVRHFSEPVLYWSAGLKPQYPEKTILLAEVGPDHEIPDEPSAMPWRDAGRIVWDDGARPWYQGPTWLTARHAGYLSVLTFAGTAVPCWSRDAFHRQIEDFYEDCYLGGCTFCLDDRESNVQGYWRDVPHYSFASSNLYWWTGHMIPDATSPQEAEARLDRIWGQVRGFWRPEE